MPRSRARDAARPPEALRELPSVDATLRREAVRALIAAHGRPVVIRAVRGVIAEARRRMNGSGPDAGPVDLETLDREIRDAVLGGEASSLKRVINATGVVIHTNLGRARLSREAVRRVALVASSYCSLEYDLQDGGRGSRSLHVERSLSSLFPGCGAIAVNNNAAAVLLAVNTLAEGREVVISRGELVEIGGSFRIPDVIAKSGATLREVGTTNRTRLADYEKAIGPETGLLLKVHTSNYRIVGFTQETELRELADLAARRHLDLMVDQGSGTLLDLDAAGVRNEPTVGRLLEQGAGIVTFSGDKVMGGPQAGLIVGKQDLVKRMRVNPIYRALRLDKMTIAALEATLESYLRETSSEDLPTWRMITAPESEIRTRAERIAGETGRRLGPGVSIETREGASRVGGGAAPDEDLPSVIVRLAGSEAGAATLWQSRLRKAAVPVVARVQDGALWLDPRTVDPSEEEDLIESVIACLRDEEDR